MKAFKLQLEDGLSLISSYRDSEISLTLRDLNIDSEDIQDIIMTRVSICEIIFDFSIDDNMHLESKKIKRDCLLDLIDFFDSDE